MTELHTADPDIERLYTSREGLTIMLHSGETIDLSLDLLTEACTAIMQQWRADWAKQNTAQQGSITQNTVEQYGGLLTINKDDPTKFDISAGRRVLGDRVICIPESHGNSIKLDGEFVQLTVDDSGNVSQNTVELSEAEQWCYDLHMGRVTGTTAAVITMASDIGQRIAAQRKETT